MRPLRRQPVNKARSASAFRKSLNRTKGVNLMVGPMRGGIRL